EYSGDTHYNLSRVELENRLDQEVVKADTTLDLAIAEDSTVYGEPFVLTATVDALDHPNATDMVGDVTFYYGDGNVLGTVAKTAAGSYEWTLALTEEDSRLLMVGDHAI